MNDQPYLSQRVDLAKNLAIRGMFKILFSNNLGLLPYLGIKQD